MGIGPCLAQSRKMFSTREDAVAFQPFDERSRKFGYLGWVISERPLGKCLSGGVSAEVEDGREVQIETEQPQGGADKIALLMGERGLPGPCHTFGGRQGRQELFQAVDGSSFLIDRKERPLGKMSVEVSNELSGLFRRAQVAGEEDDAGGAVGVQKFPD